MIHLFFLYGLIVQSLHFIKFSLFSVQLRLRHVQVVLGHAQLCFLNCQVSLGDKK